MMVLWLFIVLPHCQNFAAVNMEAAADCNVRNVFVLPDDVVIDVCLTLWKFCSNLLGTN